MVKKKRKNNDILDFTGEMVIGGTGLTLGSSMVDKMPDVPSKANLQSGFTTFSGFMPTFGAIGGAGITLKQLKKIKLKGGKS